MPLYHFTSYLQAAAVSSAKFQAKIFDLPVKEAGFGRSCCCGGGAGHGEAKDDGVVEDAAVMEFAQAGKDRAIHDAWVFAQKAQTMARKAADRAQDAALEAARVQKYLDPFDVIKVQTQTEMDVRKAEAVEGLVE
eukprot:GEMP01083074.1.p2 GENE.GEMP01083074.1~~GEMP01083074.1.p2  ORF type:complete len:135 (+),score=38.41 GEMP01083074.1:206-610(+)